MSKNQTRHRVIIEVTNHWWFWRKYRAFCKNCDHRGPWRDQEKIAMTDGWYHDDITLFQMLTRKPPVDS